MLELLLALAELGRVRDPRAAPAIELLLSKQDAAGRWRLETTLNGKMCVDIERAGEPSKWLTLRALRVLDAAGAGRARPRARIGPRSTRARDEGASVSYDDYEHLAIEVTDGVAVVRMNRPERLNAFNATMAMELLRVPGELHDDPDVRCVVLTGTGRGFCSGLDIKDVADAERTMFGHAPMDEIGISGRFTLAWYEIDKPTISAINGVAAGGGLGFALMQDIRIAGESARLIPMFTKRGVAPEVGVSWTAVHAVGLQRALAWYYTDRELSAQQALEWGAVLQVVPDDQLMDVTMELATNIAAGPPLTVRLVRRSLYHAAERPELRDHLRYAWTNVGISGRTEDIREGSTAVAEKRAPKFVGC